MLRRKMYDFLKEWKTSHKNECLFIKGARQIGKTYLVETFGKSEYKSFIEINFLKYPGMKEIFDGDISADEIYKRMSAYMADIHFIPGDTLIFLDEIQKCARARTALKFLAMDGKYDVIASGSLLGLHYGQDDDKEVTEIESVPVGYEKQVTMYSLDFEEYLWANGYSDETIHYLKSFFDNCEAVPNEINSKYEELFREYMVVGGMPEVVASFVTDKDFNKAHSVQEKILATYDDDIAGHAVGAEKIKVRDCYHSIPRQLARENKKFKYSEVEKKATSRKYGDSIVWLRDSNLVHISYNTFEPYLPLLGNAKEDEFKVYMNDTGLLMAFYGKETKLALLNGTLKGNAKGGIYENIISECIVKKGYTLNYYKTQNNSMEIEFLIEKDGGVIPVEVKAGNTSTPSLNNYISTFDPEYTYKFISGNVGKTDKKIVLPHYMVMFI